MGHSNCKCCSGGHHSKGSCCGGGSSCGCGCSSCGCGGGSCGCGCHQKSCCSEGSCCDYAENFLALADEAWMEVLKDKIKEHILSNDQKINEIAKIVAEANCERWKKKMACDHCCDSYEDKLSALFESCCNTNKQQQQKK